MSLVKMSELLHEAQIGKYAVGAFNVANMEMVMGAIKAGEELNSPMIIQVAEGRLRYSPLNLIGPMMVAAAKNAKVPVAVNLDHGATLENIETALKIGFTNVMIDGSKFSLNENIKITNEVTKLAKKYDASVEAEIGRVGGSEDDSESLSSMYTDVNEAERFYNSTSIDALAIAIGNAHGVYKEVPKLNIGIVEKVAKTINVPLVLHGGTGLSEEDFKNCIIRGIRKINVATATFISVEQSVRKLYETKEDINYFNLHMAEVEGAYCNVKRYIKIFGSENRVKSHRS